MRLFVTIVVSLRYILHDIAAVYHLICAESIAALPCGSPTSSSPDNRLPFPSWDLVTCEQILSLQYTFAVA